MRGDRRHQRRRRGRGKRLWQTSRPVRGRRGACGQGPRRFQRTAAVLQRQHHAGQHHVQQQPAVPDKCGRVQLRRRKSRSDQQRPVRHVHARVARSADDHVHDQRGCHLVRRHAGRCERSATALGGAEQRVQLGRHHGHRRWNHGGGGRRGQPDRHRPRRRRAHVASGDAYAAAFDPEDPNRAELLEGYRYKESAGIAFDSSSEALELVTQFPEISEDGRSIRIVFDSFEVDYETDGLSVGNRCRPTLSVDWRSGSKILPRRSRPWSTPSEPTSTSQDPADSEEADRGEWNTAFNASALPADPGLYLSHGPYLSQRTTSSAR